MCPSGPTPQSGGARSPQLRYMLGVGRACIQCSACVRCECDEVPVWTVRCTTTHSDGEVSIKGDQTVTTSIHECIDPCPFLFPSPSQIRTAVHTRLEEKMEIGAARKEASEVLEKSLRRQESLQV